MSVVVLGAGVAGLTSAVCLLEAGLSVNVVAHRFAPDITSSVAAGLWYPYATAGSRIPALAVETLRYYRELVSDPGSGIRFLNCTSYEPAENLHPFWADEDVDFRPIDNGFTSVLPLADSGIFLKWLVAQIEALGGTIEQLPSPIEDLEAIEASIVVNCTGLGARHLCSDHRVVPIKGTVVVVDNPGIDYCLTDDRVESQPTYFIPTAAGLVLGGSAERGNWSTDFDPDLVDDIIHRCAAHEPKLEAARIRARIRMVKSGLRPGRDEIRLEREELPSGKTVVHNYGHGGSGYTLCWGCANEVVRQISAIS